MSLGIPVRRPPVIWMTCLDGHDHAIPDEHMATTSGRYETACGRDALPAASQDPPSPRCPSCLRLVRDWLAARSPKPSPKPAGWASRVFRR